MTDADIEKLLASPQFAEKAQHIVDKAMADTIKALKDARYEFSLGLCDPEELSPEDLERQAIILASPPTQSMGWPLMKSTAS